MARLNALGVRTVMLTGDNRRTAAAIADSLGLEAKAELLPDAKLAEIKKKTANATAQNQLDELKKQMAAKKQAQDGVKTI